MTVSLKHDEPYRGNYQAKSYMCVKSYVSLVI